MVNNKNQIWKDKKIATNAWLTIPSSWTSEILGKIGFDFLTIDMQHGLADYQTVISILQSLSNSGSIPLVRVPWIDAGMIMRILDAGARGIICPMINNREEARDFVGACRYPPLGYRSLGPIRAELNFEGDYFENSNNQILTLAMIETADGINNINEILSIEGLDGVYIGTMDLSISLGIEDRGELTNRDLINAIEKIMESVEEHGLIAGIHSRSIQDIAVLKNMGFSIITPLNDSRLLQSAAESVYRQTLKMINE